MKKKTGIGVEGKIHKQFASIIIQYEGYKRLKADWWSYDASGEKRNLTTASLLKAKGLRGGKPDYEFISVRDGLAYYLYIEFKRPKVKGCSAGKQSDNQKKFQDIFNTASNCNYYICYSVKEAIDILIANKFLEI